MFVVSFIWESPGLWTIERKIWGIFTWHGGHVSVPNQSLGSWTLLLFNAYHVSEKTQSWSTSVCNWRCVSLLLPCEQRFLSGKALSIYSLTNKPTTGLTNDANDFVNAKTHARKNHLLAGYFPFWRENNFIFSYLGFSLDSRPGFWWTAVWVACGLGAIGIAVLILRFIEEVIAWRQKESRHMLVTRCVMAVVTNPRSHRCLWLSLWLVTPHLNTRYASTCTCTRYIRLPGYLSRGHLNVKLEPALEHRSPE